MPIYEYECERCHRIIEKWQGITEEPLTTCPDCQGLLKKVVSKSSFLLKGGGWFADGYSNGQKAPEKTAYKKDNGGTTPDSKKTKSTEKENKTSGAAEYKSSPEAAH
ncbi:MAG: FmdB family zinc ribbon protein [Thermodesulfobacteriota bacterium]